MSMGKLLIMFGWFYAGAWLLAGLIFFGLEPLWKFILN